ncbi:hypothetical protein B5S30_g4315 [[Candida] boidinii]|nr:hypothetical protein B5S30_g4315 [[Candida] boidinii]
MAFLFKRNPKTPSELIRFINDQVVKLDSTNDRKKANDELNRYLAQLKIMLTGNGDDIEFQLAANNVPPVLPNKKELDLNNTTNNPITTSTLPANTSQTPNTTSTLPFSSFQPDQIAQLSQEVYSTDCLYLLILNLGNMDFDSRKVVTILFSTLLRRKIANRSPTVDYLLSKPKILLNLMKGPERPDTAMNTGIMLRDAIKYEQITRYLLKEPLFWKYFEYSQIGTFENTTDAFSTLSDFVTVHKKIFAEFLDTSNNLEKFIRYMNSLITCSNYVTKRQSIKLLSFLFLQKPNYQLMSTYVSSPHNLKIIMTLLGDKSKNIQYESFQIFKVFIANPQKAKPISDILIKNRDRLLMFLNSFKIDKNDDGAFTMEKDFVIQQITDLPKIVLSTTVVSPTVPPGQIAPSFESDAIEFKNQNENQNGDENVDEDSKNIVEPILDSKQEAFAPVIPLPPVPSQEGQTTPNPNLDQNKIQIGNGKYPTSNYFGVSKKTA